MLRPWLLLITGYFYGIIHSINGVFLVLITNSHGHNCTKLLGTSMIYLGLRPPGMSRLTLIWYHKQIRKMRAIFRKRWRVHLFLMDIAWYSWVLSYLFLKISISSSYFPWNYVKQHIESKFQIFDLLEDPTSIRSMNPALNFRVPPSRAMAMAGRVAGTVIMAMLAFVILLCGVAFFFGRNLGNICDGWWFG